MDRRARFFGSHGLWILVVGIAIISAQIFLLTAKREQTAPEARADAVFAFLVGLGLGILVIALWKAPAVIRDLLLLRRFEDAVVMSAVRTPPLIKALSNLTGAQTARVGELPRLFSAVATPEGLDFYSSGRGAPVISLSWSRITEVEVGEVEELTRRSNALLVRLGDVALPVVVTGAGIGGLFPQSKKRLSRVIDEIVKIRQLAP